MTSPNPVELISVIDELIVGSKTRKEVAAWADEFLEDDTASHSDAVTDALEYLAAADLVGVDRPYLYTVEDFEFWKAELQS